VSTELAAILVRAGVDPLTAEDLAARPLELVHPEPGRLEESAGDAVRKYHARQQTGLQAPACLPARQAAKRGTQPKRCVVPGCTKPIRTEGLCVEHLAIHERDRRMCFPTPHELNHPPGPSRDLTLAEDVGLAPKKYRVRAIFEALGVPLMNCALDTNGLIYVECFLCPVLILDDDDVDQFAALVPTRDGQQCASTTIPIPMYIGIGTALVPKEAGK